MWTGRFGVFCRHQNWLVLCFFIVVLYFPRLFTEWVKQVFAEMCTTYLFWNETPSNIWEIHFKVIFSPPTLIIFDSCMRKKESICDTLSEELLQLFSIHLCSRYSYNFRTAAPVYDVLLWCFAYYVKPLMFIFSSNLHCTEHENIFNIMVCVLSR